MKSKALYLEFKQKSRRGREGLIKHEQLGEGGTQLFVDIYYMIIQQNAS
jgi:hypothetical protein